jgi:hypothetical protein
MCRLMQFYPQQFTLHLKGEQFTVRAEYLKSSTTLFKNSITHKLEDGIKPILRGVLDLNDPTIFMSAYTEY